MYDAVNNYEHILRIIELNVVMYYREHPKLADSNLEKIYNSIQRTYEKEIQEKNPPKLRFNELEQDLFDSIHHITRYFIGEAKMEVLETDDNEDETSEKIEDMNADFEPVSKKAIVDCMKRLRSSIKIWSGNAYGRQGYLNYISQFM